MASLAEGPDLVSSAWSRNSNNWVDYGRFCEPATRCYHLFFALCMLKEHQHKSYEDQPETNQVRPPELFT